MVTKKKVSRFVESNPDRDPGNLMDSLRSMVKSCNREEMIQDRIVQAQSVESGSIVSSYPDESERE